MSKTILKPDHTLITSFLEMLASELGLAENTIKSYYHDLTIFLKFLASQNCQLIQVDETIIEQYLSMLHDEELSSTSVSRKLSCLAGLFNFLEREYNYTKNPLKNIKLPPKSHKLPKMLSEQEILLLLKTISKDNSEFGIRLNCMLEILYASGLRVSELTSLPLSAVQRTKINNQKQQLKNYLLVKGKGGKERIVPLNQSALQAINHYLALRQTSSHKDSKWLFCGHFRANKKNATTVSKSLNKIPRANTDKPLTRQRFHQMLKELAVKAGIAPELVSPHIIRHSFASHLLNRGADLRVLQELLGHSDISTTQIYTHLLDSKLKELIFKHHPLTKR